MGYYVNLVESTVVLSKSNLDEMFRCFHRLEVNYDHMKRGCGYNNGQVYEKWFSWMNDWTKECEDAVDVVNRLGFVLYEYDDHWKVSDYDNKMGQEDLFFRSIAHLVNDGSYMCWEGEDEEKWGWVFEDGKMFIVRPEGTEEFMPDFSNPEVKSIG